MDSSLQRPLERTRMLAGFAAFVVAGAAAMIYLQGSGLTSPGRYHGDLTQSPHWFAYHNTRFADDDLLIRYAAFNESPVQNAIYWVGSWAVDVVLLNKLVGIGIFGLTAGLFFVVVSATAGPWTAALAASFFIVFPRSAYEIAGGFSKAWAIGLLLAGVYVVETRRWRMLLWLMPLAALTYPISPVLTGALVLAALGLEIRREPAEAIRGLKYLTAGSVLGIVPLLYKYLLPREDIGPMISPSEMKSMWAAGTSSSLTLPLWQEPHLFFGHPFFVYSAVLLLMLLHRRGVVWKRSWTTLVVASALGYYVADLVVPRLYLPDRYVRFSVAALLVLWFAHNWSRSLEPLRHAWARRAAFAAVVGFAALSFSTTFRPCQGVETQGIWEDKDKYSAVSAVLAALPSPVLVAGHPSHTAELMVQARQPVLVINRLFHAWYLDYREAIDRRIRDTFTALYARDRETVNAFAERYGITHMIVGRREYGGYFVRRGNVYRAEYNKFIAGLVEGQEPFVLDPPPAESIVFEDHNFWLVRLPLR